MRIILLAWWLAIIAQNGETIFMEWHFKESCQVYERLFKRVHGLKVTSCTYKNTDTEVG